jgi:hypothetical protein
MTYAHAAELTAQPDRRRRQHQPRTALAYIRRAERRHELPLGVLGPAEARLPRQHGEKRIR